jgi:hypothetical protein
MFTAQEQSAQYVRVRNELRELDKEPPILSQHALVPDSDSDVDLWEQSLHIPSANLGAHPSSMPDAVHEPPDFGSRVGHHVRTHPAKPGQRLSTARPCNAAEQDPLQVLGTEALRMVQQTPEGLQNCTRGHLPMVNDAVDRPSRILKVVGAGCSTHAKQRETAVEMTSGGCARSPLDSPNFGHFMSSHPGEDGAFRELELPAPQPITDSRAHMSSKGTVQPRAWVINGNLRQSTCTAAHETPRVHQAPTLQVRVAPTSWSQQIYLHSAFTCARAHASQ